MESKLIIVGDTQGGPGKSTVAQSRAAGLLLNKNKKVHITELDIQRTTTSQCEDRRNNSDLDLMPFSYVDNDVIKHLHSLNGRYDYIVADAGGFDSLIQRQAMSIPDVILLPLRPKRRDLKSLRDLDPVLSRVPSVNPDVKIVTVMNQCPSQASRILGARDVGETFGLNVVPVNLYNRNDYDDAEEAGRSIFEMKGKERDKKAESEAIELVEYIISLDG